MQIPRLPPCPGRPDTAPSPSARRARKTAWRQPPARALSRGRNQVSGAPGPNGRQSGRQWPRAPGARGAARGHTRAHARGRGTRPSASSRERSCRCGKCLPTWSALAPKAHSGSLIDRASRPPPYHPLPPHPSLRESFVSASLLPFFTYTFTLFSPSFRPPDCYLPAPSQQQTVMLQLSCTAACVLALVAHVTAFSSPAAHANAHHPRHHRALARSRAEPHAQSGPGAVWNVTGFPDGHPEHEDLVGSKRGSANGQATFYHPATEGGAQSSCGKWMNDDTVRAANFLL